MKSVHPFLSSALSALLFTAAHAQASELVVANFGGANGKAQEVAFLKPFAKASKTVTRGVEYDGSLAPVRKMVLARKTQWDVVEVESSELTIGCTEGLFEQLDKRQLGNTAMALPGSIHNCGVGAFVWSTVMAYNSATYTTDKPRNWADFWDVEKFPGKRAMRKGARYNLEFALMADGVHRRDVYQVLSTESGLQRALNKIKQLAPHIVWWESGSQPPKMLAANEVVMSTAYNGRISAAVDDGATLETVWTDAIYDMDYWAVVKGSPNVAQAKAFIRFATTDTAQLAFSKEIAYGPTHFNAILEYDKVRKRPVADEHLIDLSMAPSDLPSAPGNLLRSLGFDPTFWVTKGARIETQMAQMLQ
ncbi:ABC transporter substrate-binding protein [Hydrogenophaga sp. 5NK40-0174]|uniref:ABC transporter substrate-binding protein n=1 Tax=Hydrogenophaga sp. 5NK40-0174 TaxID=3127649 RepID=UPI00310B24D8